MAIKAKKRETGYQARPWLKLVPKPKATEFNLVRLYMPDKSRVALDGQVTATAVRMSLDEAATVTVSVADPDGALPLASASENQLLDGVDVRWRGLWWRVARIERTAEGWSITCEDRIAAYLRSHKRSVTASRASVTRAQFVRKLALGVKAGGGIPMYIPELKSRQGIYKPEEPKAKKTKKKAGIKIPDGFDGSVWDTGDASGSGGGAGGWGKAAGKVKVKGATANTTQLACIDEVLSTAASVGATRRVMIATVMCITQETVAGVSVGGNSIAPDVRGPFQQRTNSSSGWTRSVKSAMDAGASCKRFLLGGDLGAPGWRQKHGSVKASDGNLGQMIDAVQVAGTPSAFGKWEHEATKTIDLWLSRNQGVSGDDDSADQAARYYRGQYAFRTSEESGAPRNWWDAMGQLADEVQWHRWAVCNTLGYATDKEMIRQNVVWWISRERQEIHDLSWSWDYRREASELEVTVALPDPFSLLPGMVAMVDDEQPIDGRWLVDTIDVDPLANNIASVSLRRVGAKLLEPAPVLKERKESKKTIGGKGDYGVFGKGSGSDDAAGDANSNGLVYPAEKHGKNGGGPSAHGARAWGNWQSDNAVDILLPRGTRIFAVADGVVTKLGGRWNGGSGNPDGWNVTLHTSDNDWFYTHLMERSPGIKVGTKVKAGQYLGKSGAANGVDHLHIGSRVGDPVKLLKV